MAADMQFSIAHISTLCHWFSKDVEEASIELFNKLNEYSQLLWKPDPLLYSS
jgi:hypothetical protein